MSKIGDLEILLRNNRPEEAAEYALSEIKRREKANKSVDHAWVEKSCEALEKNNQPEKSFLLLSNHLEIWQTKQTPVDDCWQRLSLKWEQMKRDRGEVLITKERSHLAEIDSKTGKPLEDAVHNKRLLVIIDVETTGLKPEDGAEIIELAFAQYSINCKTCTLDALIEVYKGIQKPIRKITQEITDINGITNRIVKGKKLNKSAINSAIDNSAYQVAHNAQFDQRFLKAYSLDGTRGRGANNWKCSCWDIDWKHSHGLKNHKLATITRALGHRAQSAHNALCDVDTVSRVLSKPIYLSELLGLQKSSEVKPRSAQIELPWQYAKSNRAEETHAFPSEGRKPCSAPGHQEPPPPPIHFQMTKDTAQRVKSSYKTFRSLDEKTQLIVAVSIGCLLTVALVATLFSFL